MPITVFESVPGARKERRFRRFNLECPVFMKFISGGYTTEVEALTKNISIGGFLAESAFVIPLYASVTFRICVRGQTTVRYIYLAGEGEIVRIESKETDAIFAIAVNCSNSITQLEEYLSTKQPAPN